MAEEILKISIPLDDEHYLRRECKLCKKEFKIKIDEKDLKEEIDILARKYIDNDSENNSELVIEDKKLYYCPYCGKESEMINFWTNAQEDYIHTHIQNYVNKIINDKLIKELKKIGNTSNSFISIKTKELPYIEPFISPEENDMDV